MSSTNNSITMVNNLPQTPAVRLAAAEIMEAKGFNPIAKLVELADELAEFTKDADTPIFINERIKVLTALAKFYIPQPKAIDIHVSGNESPMIQIVQFDELYKEREAHIPKQGCILMDAEEVQ